MSRREVSHCSGLDREIVLDIFRLSTRLLRATPNGIDRADASFAAHLANPWFPFRIASLGSIDGLK